MQKVVVWMKTHPRTVVNSKPRSSCIDDSRRGLWVLLLVSR